MRSRKNLFLNLTTSREHQNKENSSKYNNIELKWKNSSVNFFFKPDSMRLSVKSKIKSALDTFSSQNRKGFTEK